MTLEECSISEKVIIKQIIADDQMTRRFMDIGMIEGTKVEKKYESYWNDPAAYYVRGAVIAIRKKDAQKIKVERINHEILL